jgi:hypothetical protein
LAVITGHIKYQRYVEKEAHVSHISVNYACCKGKKH